MYRNVETKIWDDPKFHSLSIYGQHLFFWLMTNRHGHYSGLYYCLDQLIPTESKLNGEQLKGAWAELLDSGMVRRDGRLVWVVNMLKYHGRGSKTWKGVGEHFATLHPSPLRDAFLETYTSVKTYISDGASRKEKRSPGKSISSESESESESVSVSGTEYSPGFERFWQWARKHRVWKQTGSSFGSKKEAWEQWPADDLGRRVCEALNRYFTDCCNTNTGSRHICRALKIWEEWENRDPVEPIEQGKSNHPLDRARRAVEKAKEMRRRQNEDRASRRADAETLLGLPPGKDK